MSDLDEGTVCDAGDAASGASDAADGGAAAHAAMLSTRWTETLRLLADSTRFRLLVAMHFHGPGQASVTELSAAAGVSRAAASAALQKLAVADVVGVKREGREAFYSLIDADVHALLHYLGAGHTPTRNK